jgi:opacity protein-like surface antigen
MTRVDTAAGRACITFRPDPSSHQQDDKRRKGTMKSRTRFACAALLATLAGSTAAAAQAGPVKTVTCAVVLNNVAPPGLTGEEFGTVRCPSVFGNGVVHDTYTVTPESGTTGTVNGRYTEYFDEGTIRGTFKLAYTISPQGVLSSKGTAKIAGGTGAFKRAKGKTTVDCQAESETRTKCKETRKLTF